MKKRKLRFPRSLPFVGRIVRLLLRSQFLTIFLALCMLGLWVGFQTRPDPREPVDLFDDLSVVSYRDYPGDTTSHFVVDLGACGKAFSRYDVDSRQFLPPERVRVYRRVITGTDYRPLHVRGHIGDGLWVQVPAGPDRTLLPEQFDELCRTTLGYMKPVSVLTNVLGMLSGYSVGYRLATWGGSLCNHKVQERVLATPGLGRTLAREAWRRVALEPVVMLDADDAARFAAIRGTHRLYANFFRLALHDSDSFIPREAERLRGLARAGEARAMQNFVSAVRRAADDTVHLNSEDFGAVERWASLLDRWGHWAHAAIPPAGEERARYLGTLTWYGLEPPVADANRVWVGPRMLVREGDAEGFVADDVPATGVGCPEGWRRRLAEEKTGADALASAWFADRPEFVAIATLGRRTASGLAQTARRMAERRPPAVDPTSPPATGPSHTAAGPGHVALAAASPGIESFPRRSVRYDFESMGDDGTVLVVTTDSARTAPCGEAARATGARVDSLMDEQSATSEVSRLNREAAPGPAAVEPEVSGVLAEGLRTWRESGGAFDVTTEPLLRAWGLAGGPPRTPTKDETDAALALVGGDKLVFDPAARTLQFKQSGTRIDLEGLARGHAVDAVADTLRARGVRDALVELSGRAYALGSPADAEHWHLAISDPRDRGPVFARLTLAGGQGGSTSGKYEAFTANGKTYARVLDPRSGRPAEGLISVTVLAPTASMAEAWGAALSVLGPAEARRKAKERADLDAVLIEPGVEGVDTVWVEESLRDRFALDPEARPRVRVAYF